METSGVTMPQCPVEGPERRDAGGRQQSRAHARDHVGTLLRRGGVRPLWLRKDGRPIGWMVSVVCPQLGEWSSPREGSGASARRPQAS